MLKKHLKDRKIFARWVPHLLTNEQNIKRVKVAKKLLQMFQLKTKSSLSMSSKMMKLGSILLSPSDRLAIKSEPLNTLRQMPNNCQTVFGCKEGFGCNFLLW